MAVMPNQEPHKYGGLAATPDGAMTGIVKRGDTTPSQHFVGIQVVEAEAFRAVPPDVPWESVAALYPALIAAKPGSVRTCTVAVGIPRHRHTAGLPGNVPAARARGSRAPRRGARCV